MANGEQGSKPSVSSVILAVLALLTAIIPNIDKITDFWRAAFSDNRKEITGDWNGIWREFSTENGKEQITSSLFEIHSHNGNFSGTSSTSYGIARKWKIVGQDVTIGERRFLILNYVSSNPNRASVGSWVLEYVSTDNTFKGYHIGFDPEQKKLISYPHILTKLQPEIAEKQYEAFLKSTIATTSP